MASAVGLEKGPGARETAESSHNLTHCGRCLSLTRIKFFELHIKKWPLPWVKILLSILTQGAAVWVKKLYISLSAVDPRPG
jgi:hypothetical protein